MNLEAKKLECDILKHMTTLSTGSIVILATFLDKMFLNPEWKLLIALAFLSFMLSIIGSIVSMWCVQIEVLNEWRKEEAIAVKHPNFTNIISVMVVGGFFIGIFSLSVFALKNFL